MSPQTSGYIMHVMKISIQNKSWFVTCPASSFLQCPQNNVTSLTLAHSTMCLNCKVRLYTSCFLQAFHICEYLLKINNLSLVESHMMGNWNYSCTPCEVPLKFFSPRTYMVKKSCYWQCWYTVTYCSAVSPSQRSLYSPSMK